MLEKKVYLGLGSNLQNRKENLFFAIAKLETAGVTVGARSSVYETEPQDVTYQPWFLNMVVECQTRLFPMQLLATLKKVEHDMGRLERGAVRGGPRILDLDILLFGQLVMNTEHLAIPHPRMFGRRFVLEPLLELAPAIRDPQSRMPMTDFLSKLKGQAVRRLPPE